MFPCKSIATNCSKLLTRAVALILKTVTLWWDVDEYGEYIDASSKIRRKTNLTLGRILENPWYWCLEECDNIKAAVKHSSLTQHLTWCTKGNYQNTSVIIKNLLVLFLEKMHVWRSTEHSVDVWYDECCMNDNWACAERVAKRGRNQGENGLKETKLHHFPLIPEGNWWVAGWGLGGRQQDGRVRGGWNKEGTKQFSSH